MEKYEKTEHSKIKCFLHISQEAEIHTTPKTRNMGKVDFHSTKKVWENTNIPKLRVSQIFRVKQKSIQFAKHGKSGFP